MGVRKLSNIGGWTSKTSYTSMLAGNAVFSPTDYDSIATVTLGTAQSSITFSSIPSSYQHLQLRGIARGGSEAGIVASFNGNGGSGHALYGRGTTNSAGSYQETAGIPIGVTPESGNNAADFGAFVVDILDYSNTNKYKTTRSLAGMEITGSGNSYVFFQSGLWQYTSAISSIVLTINGGANFAQYSHFALYGIKG